MKASELRDMTRDELVHQAAELKRKQFKLRFQRASGELSNTAELQKARKDVARVMTIIAERTAGATKR